MATAFLDRYFTSIDQNLSDPSVSVRLTKDIKYTLLRTIELKLWNRILKACGEQSSPGYAESDITLQNDVEFYRLPGNFQSFERLERRVDGDPNNIDGIIRTIPRYSSSPGIELLSPQQGFRIQPVPNLSADETWTMIYTKGPVFHFNGAVTGVVNGTNGQIAYTAPSSTDNGRDVAIANYYKGAVLRVYDGPGADQEQECISSTQATNTLEFRASWTVVPTTSSFIESVPFLPEGLDELFGLTAAIQVLAQRNRSTKLRGLEKMFADLWPSCVDYISNLTTDRGPQPLKPYNEYEPDDGYESAYGIL